MNTEVGRMEGWLMYSDGVVERDCSGIGMIYGVHYGQVDVVLNELIDHACDFFDAEENSVVDGCVSFEISNIYYEDGQMTFPETGQWDFPPHYEFDFKVTDIERFTTNDADANAQSANTQGDI